MSQIERDPDHDVTGAPCAEHSTPIVRLRRHAEAADDRASVQAVDVLIRRGLLLLGALGALSDAELRRGDVAGANVFAVAAAEIAPLFLSSADSSPLDDPA